MATPPFPSEIAHVWNAWVRIRRRKASGVNGVEPVTWLDIDAFLRRSSVRLSPPDTDLLEIIDDAYLASFSAGPSPAEESIALKDGLARVSKPSER